MPKNANMRIEPKLRKKFSYEKDIRDDMKVASPTHLFQLIARVEDNRG